VIQRQWAFVGFRRTREIVVGLVVVVGCVIDCHVLPHACVYCDQRPCDAAAIP
jgi:hypothetical protein